MASDESSEATSDHRCIPRDSVDRLCEDWSAVRPTLDFTPAAVIARLDRVLGHIEAELERLFADHDLTAADFAVLAALARLQAKSGVSQRRLMEDLGLTSGTVSVRMDRLQASGLIGREADPADRRNSKITLTRQGRSLFERIVPDHLDGERRLLAALSEPERELLAALLGKLLVEFEGSLPPEDASLRLGLTAAPAHVTIAMRQAVGLSAEPGLLVRRVDEGGPAGQAGLEPGDVILAASHRKIRSISALYAAIADSAARGRLKLRILRGGDTQKATVRLPDSNGGAGLGPARTPGRGAHGEHTL